MNEIRPGSALGSEPALARALAGKRESIGPVTGWWRKFRRLRAEDIDDTVALLAALPWRRVGYRYGCWHPDYTLWKGWVSFDFWTAFHWGRNDDELKILDPESQQISGVFRLSHGRESLFGGPIPGRELFPAAQGVLEFVGNARTVGVVRPVGGGPETVRLIRCTMLKRKKLRDDVDTLRTGQRDFLPAPYLDLDMTIRDVYRRWYADFPERPDAPVPDGAQDAYTELLKSAEKSKSGDSASREDP